MRRNTQRSSSEKYELERSPFHQRPTQRDIAKLLGETRDDLRRLINYKEQFIVRRLAVVGKKEKLRDLRYPVSRLRSVHERIKFHLNKIKQPSYLLSPRKGMGQRDNAFVHLCQEQYLTLDIKQFYPSTTSAVIHSWFQNDLKMYGDVAGLLAHLCTIDERASMGSPLTPVLCTLVHRHMFDRIADVCIEHGLEYSVWVDDITISGKIVSGEVVDRIRAIIRESGMKSHKIRYRSGSRPVFITGIGVVGASLVVPNYLNIRIKEMWGDYHDALTIDEKDFCIQNLLSQLGTVRHIVGSGSALGRRASDQMNNLRQKRAKIHAEAALNGKALKEIEGEIFGKKSLEDLPF